MLTTFVKLKLRNVVHKLLTIFNYTYNLNHYEFRAVKFEAMEIRSVIIGERSILKHSEFQAFKFGAFQIRSVQISKD